MYPDDYLNFESSEFVRFVQSPYDSLNNWSAHQIHLWGKFFPTAEHAFNYKKFDMTDMDIAGQIMRAPSPWAVDEVADAYKAQIRDDWESLQINIMKEILEAKADQNKDIKERLHKTGIREIIYNSPDDKFWGCGSDGQGRNHLGKIWMEIRNKLVK